MKQLRTGWQIILLVVALAKIASASAAPGLEVQPSPIRLIEIDGGNVEVMPSPATVWIRTQTNQVLRPFDRIRTGPNTRAALRWSDRSILPMGPLTEIEILPPRAAGAEPRVHFLKGVLSFFHRGPSGSLETLSRGANASIDGTEFALAIEGQGDEERTVLAVIDGAVSFTNAAGGLTLTNGQQAVAQVGHAPTRVAVFTALNLLQWACYYPAVLDPRELELSADERERLALSLSAYQQGDLLAALRAWPAGVEPQTESERIFYAALLLAVGQRDQAMQHLDLASQNSKSDSSRRLTGALRLLAGVANGEKNLPYSDLRLASEFLAASYAEQARAVLDESLRRALELARKATAVSPNFGFAWARVAELQFSFGRDQETRKALETSLALVPRDAQALAIKGFLLASQNQSALAMRWYNEAIGTDPALANAWLGRGLLRIRLGDRSGGLEDLLVAAALEPRRSIMRSYLSKGWLESGDAQRARHELDLALRLDPGDPTPWLYLSLLNEQENQVNDAIRDLDTARALNDNRRVYKSKLGLDQDRAVTGVNQARVFEDAGMNDLAWRRAADAAALNPEDYTAHSFLAHSTDLFRDRSKVNLRFETPTLSEYLIANLLGPADTAIFSPASARGQDLRLLRTDGFGVVSSTEVRSSGEWREASSLSLVEEKTSLALDGVFRRDPGFRPNADLREQEVAFRWKQQINTTDSLFIELQGYRSNGGNRLQYDRQQDALDEKFRFSEEQDGLLTVGLRRRWSEQAYTLIVFNHLPDQYAVNNPGQRALVISSSNSTVVAIDPIRREQQYRSRLGLESGEVQHIAKLGNHSLVLGGRFQGGEISTTNWNGAMTGGEIGLVPFFNADSQRSKDSFNRQTFYGYWDWEIWPSLGLVSGLAYDRVQFPMNFRTAPIRSGQETEEGWLPKVGAYWNPTPVTKVRIGYAQSLAGASLDQSYRIEPTQVAGVLSTYRSLIPESLGGANAGERFATLGGYVEHQFGPSTWASLDAAWLQSTVHRTVGAYALDSIGSNPAVLSITDLRESLAFSELRASATLHQLLGHEWSVHLRYGYAAAELRDAFPSLPAVASQTSAGPIATRTAPESRLHDASLTLIYQHPGGFFSQLETIAYYQENSVAQQPDTSHTPWQINYQAGWRLWRRRFEIAAGILNVADHDFRLNPLNYHLDLPPERTFFMRVTLSF